VTALVKCANVLEPADDDKARALLAEAYASLPSISGDIRTQQQASISANLTLRGEFRKARLLCESCSSFDKVSVYTTIVQTYGGGEASAGVAQRDEQ
jgi:hypothetical protein